MKYQKGFTLLELLVVIAIIGILSSIVLASIGSARDGAKISAGKSFDQSVQRKLFLDSMINFRVSADENSFDFLSGTNPSDTQLVDVNLGAKGIYGRAIEYTDQQGYVRMEFPQNAYPQRNNQNYVFTAWINPKSLTSSSDPDRQYDPIISSRFNASGYNGIFFSIIDGSIALGFNRDNLAKSDPVIKTDVWQSVGAEYVWEGGVNSSATVNFFLNGASIGSQSLNGISVTDVINSNNGDDVIYVGFDEDGDVSFDGLISDPRFYVGRIND